MTVEELKELEEKMADGWSMANDPMCSEGFAAAKAIIDFYRSYAEEMHNLVKCIRDVINLRDLSR